MGELSYARNTESCHFVFDTIGSRMHILAEQLPEKAALVVYMNETERTAITFGNLYEKAEMLAKYFVSVGVEKGDKIALLVYNSIEWMIATVACTLVGAMSLNTLTLTSERDLNLFQGVGCKVLIVDLRDKTLRPSIVKAIKKMHSDNASLQVVVIDGPDEIHDDDIGVSFHYLQSTAFPQNVKLPENIDPEDLTTFFPTSGTTGISKLVPYSHMGLINNVCFLYSKMGIEREDVFFSDRPMGYMAGNPMPLLALGCTFVTVDTRMAVRNALAEAICNILKNESVTSAFISPYFAHDLDKLKLTRPEIIPSFKCTILSGQRISRKQLLHSQEYSAHACSGYGTTETGWTAFLSARDLPLDVEDHVIGTPLPLTEMKVVDQYGNIVPPNTAGELCVRTVSTIKNYLMSDGTLNSGRDDTGWFHTGDIVYMLDGKNFCIKGRSVEIIKRSTIKIFPASIEKILAKHPAVAEVVVVGIPDERKYQEVCACVTLKAGCHVSEPELKKYSKDQFRPEASGDGLGLMPGHFLIFESFPRLPSIKVNRRKVREMAEALVLQE